MVKSDIFLPFYRTNCDRGCPHPDPTIRFDIPETLTQPEHYLVYQLPMPQSGTFIYSLSILATSQ